VEGNLVAGPLRRQRRHEFEIPINCSTKDMFLANRVMNISHGGLFMASETSLPIDTEVSLTFTLPDTAITIRAKGRVIWSYDIPKRAAHIVRGAGIKFMDMSLEDRHRLQEWLDRIEDRTDR